MRRVGSELVTPCFHNFCGPLRNSQPAGLYNGVGGKPLITPGSGLKFGVIVSIRSHEEVQTPGRSIAAYKTIPGGTFKRRGGSS